MNVQECYYSIRAENTDTDMERYRSGHNEAVLKTVCPQGRVGSNPTLSVYSFLQKLDFEERMWKGILF